MIHYLVENKEQILYCEQISIELYCDLILKLNDEIYREIWVSDNQQLFEISNELDRDLNN